MVSWLGGISVFCLASMKAPTSTRNTFTTVFGGASSNEGMGLLNFSLDWQYIQSTFLSLPLKQQMNAWIGYVFWYICMLSLYYGNVWDTQTFPFMSTSLFQSNGTKLSTTSILNDRGTIDPTKLEAIGLPHLTFSTVWGLFTVNAAIGALITHVIIFYGKDMKSAWKQARSRTQIDPPYQAMRKYAEVPNSWYLGFFILTFFAGLIVNIKGGTTLTWWAYIVSLLLGAVIAPFSCILYGLYGTAVSTNQLSHMVGGAVQPHSPLANLYFASWSHQVILLAGWLKIGQYTKIPPRVMFGTQVYGTLLGAAFNYIVMTSIVSNQREILQDPKGNHIWSGATLQQMNGEAVTWSLAKQMYSANGQYVLVPLGFVVGLFLPIIHWGLIKLVPSAKSLPIDTAIIAFYAGRRYYGSTSWIWSTIAVGVFS